LRKSEIAEIFEETTTTTTQIETGVDDEGILDVGDGYVVDQVLQSSSLHGYDGKDDGEMEEGTGRYGISDVVLTGLDFQIDDQEDEDEGGNNHENVVGGDEELDDELVRLRDQEGDELEDRAQVLMMQETQNQEMEVENRVESPIKSPFRRKSSVKMTKPQSPLKTPKHEETSSPNDLVDFVEMPPISNKDVDILISEGDMEPLVNLILSGQGHTLLNKSSSNPEIQEFLSNVPAYIGKIASIHSAAENGNLRELQSLLDRKRLALARDLGGRVALHRAVLGGHSSIVRYLVGNYGVQVGKKFTICRE
jgi:hypothetical protein